MSSPFELGRRRLLRVSAGLVLIGALLRPDARAASQTSVDAKVTSGTAVDDLTGRAQRVMAIVVVGRRVFLGGEFTAMVAPGAGAESSDRRTRNHLAALDVDKGDLLPWNPDADAPVRAMALSPDGRKLYVGGDFTTIGGTPAPYLARLDLKTGKVDRTFRSPVLGTVKALALAGDRLYVGGGFTSATGPGGAEYRPKVAALHAATGELLPWAPPEIGTGHYSGNFGKPTSGDWAGDVQALAVPAARDRVYVGGYFTDFAGQGGLLVLDATTGQPLPEQWSPGRPVFSMTLSPDRQTVYASAGGPGGRLFAFTPGRPDPKWTAPTDGDPPGVAASDTTVYLMGHYDYAGPEGALRRHLAAFDATTGAVTDWNPVANTITGAFSAAVGAGYLFVGGEFTRINDRPQPGFAQFAIDAASPPGSSTTTTTLPRPTTTPTSLIVDNSSTTTSHRSHPVRPTVRRRPIRPPARR
jgi:outer membrane protein assembly factor BamB